jgi:FemAB-related protein (PEP-CTERM system-associated)
VTLRVRAAEATDEAAWERFVAQCEQATFFHRFGWRRVLEGALGHRCHFLLAEEGGEIVGVLPLAEVRSRLFGNKLAGLPFCVYGGIAAQHPEAARLLRDEAAAMATALGVDALELRNLEASDSGWPIKDLYYTFRKPITADNGANLKAIPNRQRAMIRKGIKEGLAGEEVEGTQRLYRVYAESVRNLGTPVFSRRYLDALRYEFAEDCRVLMIRQGDEDVAGVMSFYFRNEVLPYYGGSIARARTIRGCNHFMYWELMRRSAEEGITVYDFGRSKRETGPFEFKKNWGFEPQALPYEYFLVKSAQVPDVNPSNPKYRLLVNVWQRLPLPVANVLGPPLARNLG